MFVFNLAKGFFFFFKLSTTTKENLKYFILKFFERKTRKEKPKA